MFTYLKILVFNKMFRCLLQSSPDSTCVESPGRLDSVGFSTVDDDLDPDDMDYDDDARPRGKTLYFFFFLHVIHIKKAITFVFGSGICLNNYCN